jgi:hypothetical protein
MVDTDEVAISHLQRRKIEGRVLIPFILALRDKFGENATREVVDETIRILAAEDGARWAETYGRTTAALRKLTEELWAGGGSMDVRVVGESIRRILQGLGLSNLGFRLHCSRDHAMVVGFNSELELSRSQTIMEGATCCDFRFRKRL